MATRKKNETQDPGLGTQYGKSVTRFMNPDGTYNIIRLGAVNRFKDFYKYLIDLSIAKFIFFLILAFACMNMLFATIYLLIGVEHIQGITPEQHPFAAALYFSAQTFTTVGYGALAPKGNLTSIVAAFEAFVGLIAFAMATGLIYGRFSKPSAKIAFTRNILLTPHKDGKAVMFKIVNQRNSVLLNTKVHALISIIEHGQDRNAFSRKYYNMPLEVDFVRYFPLTWTLVHIVNEESPFFEKSVIEINDMETEVLILVEAFDETFSQMVIQKHSYAHHQWQENMRFKKNFSANDDGKIILNIHELHELEAIE